MMTLLRSQNEGRQCARQAAQAAARTLQRELYGVIMLVSRLIERSAETLVERPRRNRALRNCISRGTESIVAATASLTIASAAWAQMAEPASEPAAPVAGAA